MNDIEADLLIENAKIKQLEQELAETKHELRAAIEFIKYLDRNYSGYMAEDERFAEWRGPQEAVEGETE